MIIINLDDRLLKLTVTGHATPEEGPDWKLVCNSVSVLAQGLVYSIAKFEENHDALLGFDYKIDPGDMIVNPSPEEWARATIRKRMQIYGDGLQLVAENFPEYCRMTWNDMEIKAEVTENGDEKKT